MIDPDPKDGDRRRLETLLPELIKRVVEASVVKLVEGPENVKQFVSDLRLPKEALAVLLSQLDETKSGVYKAVSRELHDFLEKTNFADELAKVLTTLTLEIKTEVRFSPNAQRQGRTSASVSSDVNVKKRGHATTEVTGPSPSTKAPAEPQSNTKPPGTDANRGPEELP